MKKHVLSTPAHAKHQPLALFPFTVVGASLSWFPQAGTNDPVSARSKTINQVCQVKMSTIPLSGLAAPGLGGEEGTGQPTKSGRILGGAVRKINIQTRRESGTQGEILKNATHIDIELCREATIERVCQIIRPLV